MNLYVLALLMSVATIGVKYLILTITSLLIGQSKPLKENDYLADCFFATVMFLISFCLLYFINSISSTNDINSNFYLWLITVVSGSIPITTSFVIMPIYHMINSKNRVIETELLVKNKFGKNYRVFIINENIMNAYATGVLPFTKIILVGKNIYESLSKDGIEAIVGHEVGHLKHNHLLKLYIVCIVWFSIAMLVYFVFLVPFKSHPYFIVIHSVFYGVFIGGGLVFIPGFFQKKFEKEADAFSAAIVGKDNVKEMLTVLNRESKGKMEKWSFNYPTIAERIANVESISN
ncbi:MAG: M48 family metalloprotease [Cyclobacteriaceae bacterium]|nr:M48 family metalloprotease [Cyclobacteriaceae bacterium]